MKKLSFVLLACGILLLRRAPAYASNCPYGRINDPYPGLCPLYSDINNNRICDNSEVASNLSLSQSPQKIYLLVIFSTLFLYIFHWFLVFQSKFGGKSKCLSKANFRFFWNLILFLSFFPTALSGFLSLVNITTPSLLFWHNVSGSIFIVVGFFHFIVHLEYYKKILTWIKKLY